jgi:hypothetical protein
MKIKTFISIIILLIGCKEPNPNEKKIIVTSGFEIEVPSNWKYKKERGIDSFVGRIKSKEVDFYFDWSEMGYANHLAPTTEEYINEEEWEWMPSPPYMKKGITYTSGDVIGERDRIMKEKGITDTTKVQVEKIQIPKEKITFTDGRYKVILTYKDTIQEVSIEIPEKVKKYDFQIDTIGGYYRKIVKPKNGIDGMTGVYFQDLESSFNFNLVGENLSKENQERALQAFKTIKIKRE